ncbi:hypothetical protein [Hymenobacter metallicola]|uniref:Uncharacterized protein n=1 Tax=Hymenobacter metallicola TaxID=2563114 RepID=A0A4Z0QFP9_9BACT|nr:hypothetical protein [Hymenobacter metallicola]TGE28296.1 hypothetical protein E5K02_02180 [Hymenobacter metallicola]
MAAATHHLTHLQRQPLENTAALYSGPEYLNYEKNYRNVTGHQFYLSSEEQLGDVFYDGALYRNVPLLYDIRLDQLVLKFPGSPFKLRLVEEKVNYFTVKGHRFVRYAGQNTTGDLPTGYYDVLFEGKTRVLAKRLKKWNEQITGGGVQVELQESNRFYLEKDGKFYPLTSKGSLLGAVPEKKKDLRHYISAQKLSFAKDQQEQSFIKVARQYDSLP